MESLKAKTSTREPFNSPASIAGGSHAQGLYRAQNGGERESSNFLWMKQTNQEILLDLDDFILQERTVNNLM